MNEVIRRNVLLKTFLGCALFRCLVGLRSGQGCRIVNEELQMIGPSAPTPPPNPIQTGCCGAVCSYSQNDLLDRGFGIWLTEDIHWTQGYAERRVVYTDVKPLVYAVTYRLNNLLELRDVEEPAINEVLREDADIAGMPFLVLSDLRAATGYTGEELEKPCLCEIANTDEFVQLVRECGYDGLIVWENGNQSEVISTIDQTCIETVRDVTNETPPGWWRMKTVA